MEWAEHLLWKVNSFTNVFSDFFDEDPVNNFPASKQLGALSVVNANIFSPSPHSFIIPIIALQMSSAVWGCFTSKISRSMLLSLNSSSRKWPWIIKNEIYLVALTKNFTTGNSVIRSIIWSRPSI